MPGFWSRPRTKELPELEQQIADLVKQKENLEQNIAQREKNNVEIDRTRDLARAKAQHDHENHIKSRQAECEENQIAIATVRSHSEGLLIACEGYIAEVDLLAGTGMEPSAPQLLIEAWETTNKGRVLLGEQWLPAVDLLAATNAPSNQADVVAQQARETKLELQLPPRILFTRPALEKCVYGSQNHLACMDRRLKFHLQASPSKAAPSTSDTPQTHGEERQIEQLTFSNFRLECSQEPEVRSTAGGKVMFFVWMWGREIDSSVPSVNELQSKLDASKKVDVGKKTGVPVDREPVLRPPSTVGLRTSDASEDEHVEDPFFQATLPSSPALSARTPGGHGKVQSAASQRAQCANVASRTCIGSGGDLLYKFTGFQQAMVYCVACFTELHLQETELCKVIPRAAQPAQWELIFQSQAMDKDVNAQKGGEWRTDFIGQKFDVQAPKLHGPLSVAELHQRREHFFLKRKEREANESENHRQRAQLMAGEVNDLEMGIKARVEMSEQATMEHSRRLFSNAQIMERLDRESNVLREELQAAAAAAQIWNENEIKAEAIARAQAELAAEEEAERLAKMAPPAGSKKLHKGAQPLDPPTDASKLSNHRRLLELLGSDHGLLYQDDRIDVLATVHRPSGISNLNLAGASAPSPTGVIHAPSRYHNDPALAHSLWAELSLTVRARGHDSPSSRTTSPREQLTADLSASSPQIQEVHFDVEEYDNLQIDFDLPQRRATLDHGVAGALARAATAAKTTTGEHRTIRSELLHILSSYPCLSLRAQLTSDNEEEQDQHLDHQCKITMPIGITTFLKPLHESPILDTLLTKGWSAKGWCKPFKWIVPHPAFASVVGRQRSKTSASTLENAAPWDAVNASSDLMTAVSCGGAFHCSKLPSGSGALSLAAELPAHGCVPEALSVILTVRSVQDVPAARAGGDYPQVLWDVAATSPKDHPLLAQAALAAVVTQLKCPPASVFASPKSVRVDG